MEKLPLTETQEANERIAQGELRKERQLLLRMQDKRFPGAIPTDVTKLIIDQESLDLVIHWFDAAASAPTFADFIAVLKQ
jgi:hypothetical protein